MALLGGARVFLRWCRSAVGGDGFIALFGNR